MSISHKPLIAAGLVLAATGLVGCASVTPAATPNATAPVVATPAATPIPVLTPGPTLSATATPASTAAPSVAASPTSSDAAVPTVVPGSSLDPTKSDAGVAGRITIPNDTRNDWSGTHEILGHEADGSDCSPSFDGDSFGAVAWYDDAPNGMIHQMAVSLPIDETPANDGEQRLGITDGRVYVDFVNETGFGTAYSGDSNEETDGGSSTIDVTLKDGTMTFSFTATTWDNITFTGQLMCTGMGS